MSRSPLVMLPCAWCEEDHPHRWYIPTEAGAFFKAFCPNYGDSYTQRMPLTAALYLLGSEVGAIYYG